MPDPRTIVMPGGARTIVVPSGTSAALSAVTLAPAYAWPLAEPGDVQDYRLDVTAPLATIGDVLNEAAVSIMPSGPSELAAASLTADQCGVISLSLGGGVAGRNYRVRVDAQTDAGRAYSWMIGLLIDPSQASLPLPAPASAGYGPALVWGAGGLDFSRSDNSGLLVLF